MCDVPLHLSVVSSVPSIEQRMVSTFNKYSGFTVCKRVALVYGNEKKVTSNAWKINFALGIISITL